MDTFADFLRKSNSLNLLYKTLEKNGIDASIDLLECKIFAPTDTTMYIDELSFKTSDVTPPQFDKIFLNLPLKKLILTQGDVSIAKVIKLISEYPKWVNVPLVVYEGDENLYLQDGHHRFAALHFLKEDSYICEVYKPNEKAQEYTKPNA